MSVFLVKRALTFVATLFAATLVVFLVLEVLPGDPALVILGVDADPEAVDALHKKLGLDEPAWRRYVDWLSGLATGNLGVSYTYNVPVGELIVERLAVTVPLAAIAMVLSTIFGILLGVFAAANHNRPGDFGVMGFSQLGIAVPNFWFGILLILLFAVQLRWFASGGFTGWENGFWPALKSLLLPSLALATIGSAIFARVTRSSVLEVLREDYVRTARAKGLSRSATLWRHVLRNAMVPLLTIMGLQFANMMAGAIIVESVFYLPGLGRLVFQAITNRDLVVVKNVVVMLAAMVVLVNFIVDVLYAVVDPRLKARDV